MSILEQDGTFSLGLELLDHSVRVESSDRRVVDGLARCFDVASHVDGDADWGLRVSVEQPGEQGRAPGAAYRLSTIPEGGLDALWLEGTRNPIQLCSALNTWAALQPSPRCVFHAGCVARDGGAVLMPGSSHAGKSTLTAGLLGRGFGLLSDEVGAIDLESGSLVGYPRLLSLREDVLGLFGLPASAGYGVSGEPSRMVQPADVGGVRLSAADRVDAIVAPRFEVGAPLEVTRLSTGEALLALIGCSCSQARLEVAGLDWVIALARRTPAYGLRFSALAEAVTAVEEIWAEAGAR